MNKHGIVTKRFLGVLLSVMLVLSLAPVMAFAEEPPVEEPEYYFSDVPEGSYFFDAVYWALDRYVTNGTSATTFSPDLICTRGQVMTFLWRVKGEPEPYSRSNPFTDVKAGDYYEQAVLWAVGVGITNGTSATTFSPDKVCNYSEILTFLWRANGAPSPKGNPHYTRDWPNSWYKDAVSWAEEDELLEDAGDALDPTKPCTRAQTVTWLYRDAQYYVTNVQELFEAIGPGRNIHLAPGTYNLTEWINQQVGASPDQDNPYVTIEEVFDGYELQIHDLRNTEFLSDFGDPGRVQIVVQPRYANVLSFIGCDNIMLTNLTLGHTPEQGTCAGGVVYTRNCGELWLTGVDLYGCGTYGVIAEKTYGVYVSDSVIHDCSEGLVQFYDVDLAHFYGCEFSDTEVGAMIVAVDSWAVFDECSFQNLNGSFLYLDEDSHVSLLYCLLEKKDFLEAVNHPLYNENLFVRDESVI